ncbi:MAG TPA: DUF995 domain-containing protein [Rhizobiaceae bacterium]|nr:DUF995 domain-containing protein [Rhizobiaceae bacterium]
MAISRSAEARVLPGFRTLAAAAWAFSCLAAPAIAASSQDPVLPDAARLMTAGEIYELYRGKSWRWEDGAGHMKETPRQFSAWTDGENGRSWAEGRWVVTETGRMCLDATWHSEKGAFPARTCFSHRLHKGTIYQRREPDGAWYVFRHARHREDDEASKLVSEDLVTQQRDSLKVAVEKAQPPAK